MHQYIRPSIHPPVCLSARLSIHPSTHPASTLTPLPTHPARSHAHPPKPFMADQHAAPCHTPRSQISTASSKQHSQRCGGATPPLFQQPSDCSSTFAAAPSLASLFPPDFPTPCSTAEAPRCSHPHPTHYHNRGPKTQSTCAFLPPAHPPGAALRPEPLHQPHRALCHNAGAAARDARRRRPPNGAAGAALDGRHVAAALLRVHRVKPHRAAVRAPKLEQPRLPPRKALNGLPKTCPQHSKG
eukprot:359951-Chlamydomonas_euryale.AAC.3